MDKVIESIIVVGGGTAGCISALMLKRRYPQKNISIIESSKVGIVGVGESSTEHWTEFCKLIEIDPLIAITKCNGTFKHGVHFENWAEKDFVHSIDDPHSTRSLSYYAIYGHLISRNCDPFELIDYPEYKFTGKYGYKKCLEGDPSYEKTPKCFKTSALVNQYHFDTFALNNFLHNLCKNRNIKIHIDDINSIELNSENGEINSLSSEKSVYEADFFIDCSGFSKLLLHKKMNVPWVSYSKYLPVNSAIAFATEEMEEYNSYTKSTARDYGWSWTIPTQTRTGNGYVYCDSFITKEQAHEEMEKCYGKELQVSREFKFDPGRLEKSWNKNCFAVGLSQSFVEPLEATSIGSVIQQMFCFLHFLPSYGVDRCNDHINQIFDNIVDYIQAHYLVKKENTEFWKQIKYNFNLTDSLQNNLNKWRYKLPSLVDDVTCSWGMFGAINYIQILYGLDWFDIDKIKKEYYDYFNSNLTQQIVLESVKKQCSCDHIYHKDLIKSILRYYNDTNS
jgi:hypothetical protein